MFRFSKNHHQGVTDLYFSKHVHAFVYQQMQCNSQLSLLFCDPLMMVF
jgi:hypothetical protein